MWNPRLTATAGQVVDDGSRNSEKSSRDERIPVRLELSSKVGLEWRVAVQQRCSPAACVLLQCRLITLPSHTQRPWQLWLVSPMSTTTDRHHVSVAVTCDSQLIHKVIVNSNSNHQINLPVYV